MKEALQAFKLLDTSLTLTQGPNWLDRANVGNIIPDISDILMGLLIPDDNGKLVSTV